MRRLPALLAIGALLLSLAAAPPADACGGAVFEPEMELVVRAHGALEAGDYARARTLAIEAERNAVNDAVAARARRIGTMAWVRDEGAPEIELRRAIGRLGAVRNQKPAHDVQSASDLGEALARFPEHAAEARAVLEPLAEKDLLGSPHAYVALAHLSTRPWKRQAALERCEAMMDEARFMGAEAGATCRPTFVDSALSTRALRHPPSALVAMGSTFGAVLALGLLCMRRRRILPTFS